jgi:hypothetical protein
LFREAGAAIDLMKAEQGLPREKKVDLLLKNFEFFKVFHEGKTYFHYRTSQFPGSDVYSKLGRCLLCNRLASTLGATTVTAAGGIFLHRFESCEITSRYLCLALIFTTGTSEYLLSFHKSARKWFNRMPIHHCAGKAPASSGKPGWGADVSEFFVVAFGIGLNMQGHKDLWERMPFFYLVARYTDVTQAPAH